MIAKPIQSELTKAIPTPAKRLVEHLKSSEVFRRNYLVKYDVKESTVTTVTFTHKKRT